MRRPSFQFYPADWRNNANLRRCSPAARGVWVDVMCVLHDSDEYGIVRWPLIDLANSANAPIKLVRELVDKSVLKGHDKRLASAFIYVPRSGRKDGEPVTLVAIQDGPVWYSSRMVKDEYVRQHAGAASRFTPADGPAAPERKGAEGTDRAKLRARVLAKTDGHCAHCKVELDDVWEIDHFIPRAKGGRHIFSNLVASCRPCNQDKSDTMPDDWSTPSRSPSRRHGEDQGDGSTSSSSPTGYSVPNGTGAAGAGKKPRTPAEQRKSDLWRAIKTLLVESEEAKDLKAAGAIVTQAIKRFDESIALDAIEATLHKRPAGVIAYLEGACQQASGLRLNKQETLEAGNLAAAERFAQGVANEID